MLHVDTNFFDEISSFKDDGLRDYQVHHKLDIYKRWKNVDSILLQMPTGTGKTRLFVSMINDFKRYSESHETEIKVLIVTHRKELVEQIKNELFWNYNIKSTLITAENKYSHYKPLPVCVASIQTLHRRLEAHWYNFPFDFVVIDEAHHTKASTYKEIMDAYSGAKFLGVTATPYRLNGEGFTNEFNELIVSPSVKRFIEAGWLSNYDYYSIKEDNDLYKGLEDIPLDKYGEYATTPLWSYIGRDRIRSEIVGSYLKYARGKKAIIYTINKAHNKQLCEEFKQCGIIACDIDSETNSEERKRIVQDFREGKIDVLCNVDIFTEGFDCPDVEVIQLARPTKSLGLYLQQVGRGLRIASGKRKVVFLDNVGLHNRFGFPASKRMWRKHYIGQEVEETSHYVSNGNDAEPFEMKVRFRDLSEGCEKMMLIESTGINEIIENAKTNYLAEKEKRLKILVEAVFENNQKVYDEYVASYSELYMSYSSELREDLVNPCTFINCECEDKNFWKKRIRQEFKPVLKGQEITFESYEDLEDYMQTKSKMILSRFKDELSRSRIQLFQELDDYTAEQLFTLFENNYGKMHDMTKKLFTFVQHGYANISWSKMVRIWNSPKLDDSVICKRNEFPDDTNVEQGVSTKNVSEMDEIKIGDMVRHHLWGEGLVKSISDSGTSVEVCFRNSWSIFLAPNTLEIIPSLKPKPKQEEDGSLISSTTSIIINKKEGISVGDWIYYQNKPCKVVEIRRKYNVDRLIVQYKDGIIDNIPANCNYSSFVDLDAVTPKEKKRVVKKAMVGDLILRKSDLIVAEVIGIKKMGSFQKLIIKQTNGLEDWIINDKKLFWVLI